MSADGAAGRLVDVLWRTEQLATLGLREVRRGEYLALLAAALDAPAPRPFATRPDRAPVGTGG